ncbi:MAG TPA: RNA polymerase sigma factor [Steroidobacteraceae bacterium]|nr:RNA polymerase sigma factor [Steroidobacteraceae bacterium]
MARVARSVGMAGAIVPSPAVDASSIFIANGTFAAARGNTEHELSPGTPPSMSALTADDAQLVARLRHGDAGAARELYERHGAALLRFGMAMSNSRQTAEDLVHDTFVELLRHPSRFDPARGPVLAFLLGIARHRLARIARATLRDAEVAPESPAPTDDDAAEALTGQSPVTAALAAEDTADTLDRLQRIERVRAAVSDLPRVHREVIALCDLEELPYATVATILGCPIGTVRSRLSRARALLATRLEVSDESEDDEARRSVPALSLSVRGSAT